MDAFQALIEALKAFGLPGVGAVAVILIGVFAAKKVKLVVTGDQARIANLVLAAIVYGLSGDPAAESALNAALAAVLSALVYELLDWLGDKLPLPGIVAKFFGKAG